jgi:hypothetical protein
MCGARTGGEQVRVRVDSDQNVRAAVRYGEPLIFPPKPSIWESILSQLLEKTYTMYCLVTVGM